MHVLQAYWVVFLTECLYHDCNFFVFSSLIKYSGLVEPGHVSIYLRNSILPPGSCNWCHILRMTAKAWQTAQPVQPPGVSSVLFPPRNLGCLTKNRHNFLKATIIQPLSSPNVPPYQKCIFSGISSCFWERHHVSMFLHPLPSFFAFFVLFCYGKKAVINDQVVQLVQFGVFMFTQVFFWPCQDMFHCMLFLSSFSCMHNKKAVPRSKKKEK